MKLFQKLQLPTKINYFALILAGTVLGLSACSTQSVQHLDQGMPTAITLPFQALGNEPGWSVKIDTLQHADILLDHGSRTFALDLPTPEYTYAGTHYRSTYNQQPLALDILYKTCSDTMSDEVYDYEVVLRIEDRLLRGCGRPL